MRSLQHCVAPLFKTNFDPSKCQQNRIWSDHTLYSESYVPIRISWHKISAIFPLDIEIMYFFTAILPFFNPIISCCLFRRVIKADFLADQLTLSQPKGADYAHQKILAFPDFQTFQRPLKLLCQ